MSGTLYSMDILRLAAAIPHYGRLDHADGSAELRSPICGSRVLIDVTMQHGRLGEFALEVSACALGQASAALLAREALGKTLAEVRDTEAQLGAYLAGQRDDPAFWPGVDVLAKARDYPARHAAILLPFQTLAAAMTQAAMSRGEDA